jgi:hypothetical protein
MKCNYGIFFLMIISMKFVLISNNKKMKMSSKCPKGMFLYNSECLDECPNDMEADNYSMQCKKSCDNPVFIKAYTKGRCMNQCDVEFSDCSCKKDCKRTGRCCSDYKYCSYLSEHSSNKCSSQNCLKCAKDSQKCLMCRHGFYFYKNECITSCPETTNVIEDNKLCVDKPTCKVTNCEKCKDDQCVKCLHGFFLHENECSSSCPAGTRADRLNYKCQDKSTFAFFMIFPSRHSCKGSCGDNLSDCSCNVSCLQLGNCCDDFDLKCPSEMKKEKCKSCTECHEGKCKKCANNSELINNDCKCLKGFYYNIEHDQCLSLSVKESFEPHQEKLNKMLADLFSMQGNKDFGAINMKMEGNVTMNIFSGNDHPVITNEKIVNENSYNNVTNIERNEGSNNLMLGNSLKDDEQEIEDNYARYLTNFRKFANKKSEIPRRIVVNKKLKNDHPKNYPTDLEHEEGVTPEFNSNNKQEFTSVAKDSRERKVSSSNSLLNKNGLLILNTNSSNISSNNSTGTSLKDFNNPQNSTDVKISQDSSLNLNNYQSSPSSSMISQNDFITSAPQALNKIKQFPVYPEENTLSTKDDQNLNQNKTSDQHKNIIEKMSEATTPENKNGILNQSINEIKSKHTNPIPLNKFNIHINIPGVTSETSANTNNQVTVHNHYFVNDKSTTLNDAHNPNIYNFYNEGKNCKNGECKPLVDEVKSQLENNLTNLKNSKFISDKNFKEYNNTVIIQKNGVNVLLNRENTEQFVLPISQKDEITNELRDDFNFK